MKKYILTFLLSSLALVSCTVLDRPSKTSVTDDTFWRNENDVRMQVNDYYPQFFVGYNTSWGQDYAPLRGYYFSDDLTTNGAQILFENDVPASRASTSTAISGAWLALYHGANWNFAWQRKINILIDRIENRMKDILAPEAYNHWMGVAEFIKAYDYVRLVQTFGDVPYFAKDVDPTDFDTLYKDRDPRGTVMDAVYDLLKDALGKVRTNDGVNYVNRYVVAAYTSRFMLYEGTYEKYHGLDATRAKKYLEFARDAAEMVMESGNYAIDDDFHTLFGSENLSGHKEPLMYRHYDQAQGVTHHVGSYSNGVESQDYGSPNLALIKEFICQDGKPYSTSTTAGADQFDIANLMASRDPRFESSFQHKANFWAQTLLYPCKFIDREALTMENPELLAKYASMTNTNDAPIIRYGEVLLNWIEAKAELALSYGGTAVNQTDIDKSINVLRDRPIDATATSRGVSKTAHMTLSDITAAFDPNRDKGGYSHFSGLDADDYEVDPLIWEIRRERRMELCLEYSRLLDLKRWRKLHYMDNEWNTDTMLGLWVNLPVEVPTYVEADPNTGKYNTDRQVRKADGTVVTLKEDGSNTADMVGFFIPNQIKPRNAFSDRSYCAPVGRAQISDYKDKGYTLTQTTGWE